MRWSLIIQWLSGLGVWFLLWVQEVLGSNPAWAHLFSPFLSYTNLLYVLDLIVVCRLIQEISRIQTNVSSLLYFQFFSESNSMFEAKLSISSTINTQINIVFFGNFCKHESEEPQILPTKYIFWGQIMFRSQSIMSVFIVLGIYVLLIKG